MKTHLIREQTEAHPGWTALDVIRNLFGDEPTALQINNATDPRWSGDTDRRTIDSIPDQVDAWRNTFRQSYPTLTLSNAMIFEKVSAKAFNQRQMVDLSVAHVKKIAPVQITRWLDQLDPAALDPVQVMYQAIMGREPDDAGYAFWNGHYQDGIPLSELCRYMEREKSAGAE